MASTKSDLAARAAAVIPGGVNSGQRRVPGLEELVIAATSGATFTDGDGNTYTDYHAAFGPPLLGHGDPDVDAAVAATARSVGLMGVGVTEVEVELAERICELVPSAERVLLTETGSEATFQALRVARAATGRRHVIKFQGCYHGWHDSVAMNVISLPENVGRKDPLSKGVLPEVIDATIVCRFNDADDVERALAGQDVAAIILEPIPHNIGAVLPRPGFLERLRELASKHGTVLVFDEVITGFRHALGGYQSIAGVTYFLEGEPSSYDDLLANDVELFIGYRRELMKHGIFELPLNLKRSHFSYAHTDDDVDRLLEATEVAVSTVLAAR